VADDRHSARLTLRDHLTGDVTAKYAVEVLNLSMGGARLEHSFSLRPGEPCYLRVRLTDGLVNLPACVIWSRVIGGVGPTEGPLTFHTGVQFLALPAKTRSRLRTFLGGKQKH